MIKELAFDIEVSYSCQICGRSIPGTLNDNQIIITGIQPLGSDECRLLVIGKILRQYNNTQIKQVLEVALPKFKPKTRQSAISKLAVWFLNKRKEVEYG